MSEYEKFSVETSELLPVYLEKLLTEGLKLVEYGDIRYLLKSGFVYRGNSDTLELEVWYSMEEENEEVFRYRSVTKTATIEGTFKTFESLMIHFPYRLGIQSPLYWSSEEKMTRITADMEKMQTELVAKKLAENIYARYKQLMQD